MEEEGVCGYRRGGRRKCLANRAASHKHEISECEGAQLIHFYRKGEKERDTSEPINFC